MGKADAELSVASWYGSLATSWRPMPGNLPSWKRSTTASRSVTRAWWTFRSPAKCCATWLAGPPRSRAGPSRSRRPGTGMPIRPANPSAWSADHSLEFPAVDAVWKIAPALRRAARSSSSPPSRRRCRRSGLRTDPGGRLPARRGQHPHRRRNGGAAIAGHPGIDKVAFTGSTEAGNHRPVRCWQPLEGQSRTRRQVAGDRLPGCRPRRCHSGTASGIFFNMGQCCTAGSRLFVHERIFDRMM